LDPSNSSPGYKKNSVHRENSEAAAYRPGSDGHENVQMRDVVPGSNLERNDYLSLRQSIPVAGYLSPSAQGPPPSEA